MAKDRNWLDVLTNVAILCVCVLIVFIGVTKFLLTPTVKAMPAKGTHLTLSGVDWSRSDRTLLMVLSTHCHFCSESAGFYKRMLAEASTRNVPVVAIFPQSAEEGRAYLTKLEVPASNITVAQAPAGSVEVPGTPTLIVVDRKGLVVRSWTGKLQARGESEVLQQLR